MKKKTVDKYEYDGLGFPITLLNVPLIEVRGCEVPDIDYNNLQRVVLLALAQKPLPLSGNEVKFIRNYLEMTYSHFANKFGVTHASIIHWENAKNAFAKITPTTELCIRLFILDELNAKNKLFRDTFRKFNYLDLKSNKKNESKQPLTFDSKALV